MSEWSRKTVAEIDAVVEALQGEGVHKPMTTDELTALQAVLAKMTQGLAEHERRRVFVRRINKDYGEIRYVMAENCPISDAVGIVALVNAAPALIADNLAMKARVAELEGGRCAVARALD